MVRYIAHPKDKAQATAVEAFFKALKVPFETEPESNESPYDPEFVARVLAEKAAGNYEVIKTEDLWR